MSRQRDVLKGRVKKLLKGQKELGQVGEPALQCFASSIEVFVRDLAVKLKAQAADDGVMTPIELKKAVLASPELTFLHAKVGAIDETAAKYHKVHQRRKKRAVPATSASSKKRVKSKNELSALDRPVQPTGSGAAGSAVSETQSRDIGMDKLSRIDVQEDDNYDESESD